MIAERASRLRAPQSIAISREAKALRAQGVDVIDLSIGQPDFPPPLNGLDLNRLASDSVAHAYGASDGAPALRAAIARYNAQKHGLDIQPENVIVTAGSKIGILYALVALADPGTSAIVPKPCWLSYDDLCFWANIDVEVVDATAEEQLLPGVQRILGAVSGSTRVAFLNSPNNPTGRCYRAEEITELYRGMRDHNVALILDAIYDDFDFYGHGLRLADLGGPSFPSGLVYVHGFSKLFSMAGHRIGYIVAEAEIIERLSIIQAQLMTCPSTFSQQMATNMMLDLDDGYIGQIRQTYLERAEAIASLLSDAGIGFCKPEGAFYLMMDTSFIDPVSMNACTRILKEASVALVPGSAYGTCADGFSRMSLTADTATLKQAVTRILELGKPG